MFGEPSVLSMWNAKLTVNNNTNNNKNHIGNATRSYTHTHTLHRQTDRQRQTIKRSYEWWRKNFHDRKIPIDWRQHRNTLSIFLYALFIRVAFKRNSYNFYVIETNSFSRFLSRSNSLCVCVCFSFSVRPHLLYAYICVWVRASGHARVCVHLFPFLTIWLLFGWTGCYAIFLLPVHFFLSTSVLFCVCVCVSFVCYLKLVHTDCSRNRYIDARTHTQTVE